MEMPALFLNRIKSTALSSIGFIKAVVLLSTIVLFLCCAQRSYSQITITTTPADISSAIAGAGYDAVISASAVSGHTVTLSVSSDIDPGSGLHFVTLNPSPGANLELKVINPTGDPLAGSWTFSIIATASGETPKGQDFTVNVRKPIDLFLVLDKSGSMGTIISGTQTRWDALNSGVSLFFSNYQAKLTTTNDASGDQLGIRMFSTTDVPPVNAPFNVNQFIPVTRTTNLTTILGGDNFGGSTAMGPAVLSASKFLFPGGVDNGHKKAMLVFTDGEQNTPPDHSQDVVATAGSNPTVAGTDVTNGDKIQIHAIGLGVAGAATQTLYNMAHESGVAPQLGTSNIADNLSTTPPNLNLSSFLLAISNQLYAGSTPQYVDVKRGNFKRAGDFFGAADSFIVSKNIEKIFVNFVSDVQNEARVSAIVKDGQSIYLYDTSVVTVKSGRGWQTFIISVSGIRKRTPSFASDGNWKVITSTGSQSNAPYILSFTVDDHNTEMTGATTQTKELVVGDNLPLSIDFTKHGKPITNATALAIIAKPGDDLGDLLARNGSDIRISHDPDADDPGTQKLLALLKDSAFVQKLLDSNHAVSLTYNAAQKKYTGEFKQLDVSGVYQVAYIISANDTSLGTVKRYAEESVYIRFPEVNLDSSHINFVITTPPNISTLTFRPVAINGKYVGPGWGNSIKVQGSGITLTNVVDNADGSYTLTINGDPSQNVTVSIGGAKIYTGTLANIGKGGVTGGKEIWKQWWFWLIIIVVLLIIWLATRKKNHP